MKIVFYLLLGLTIVAIAPEVSFRTVESTEADSITPVSEVKAETVKESVKVAKESEKKTTPKPVDVVKTNPKNCDRVTEWILPDGSCKDKAVGGDSSVVSSSNAPIVGSGNCEDAIRRIFPASQHSTAIRIMLAESSGVVDNHNYNPATKDNSYGCFQINIWGANAATRPPASELVKADVNVRYAYNLWQSTGWCSTGGWLNTSKKIGIC